MKRTHFDAQTAHASSRPVFCIVDQSLRDVVGHHFAYDRSVAQAAEAVGFEAVTLGHHAVIPMVARAMRVEPTFRRDMWGWHPWVKSIVERGGRWERPGHVLDQLLCGRDFAVDLRRALVRMDLPAGSVLLAHMLMARHLPGCASVLRRLFGRARSEVTAILLLRYQPFYYDNPFAARGLRQLEALAAQGHRIRLASDSGRLADEIGRLTELPIEILPIPHTPPQDAADPDADDRPLRFVSLGNARDEKGYLEILQAIRILADEPEALAGMEFVLQSNDPGVPAVKEAIHRLSLDCPPQLRLIHESLDEESYQKELADAHVVLAPYWRSTYEARTSGVFLEALAAGKPVIATVDTWMSDELTAHGAGILVSDRDPAALAGAIRRMTREFAAMADRAREGCLSVRERHSARALVSQCMGPPPPPRPRPKPRRLAVFYPWEDLLVRRYGSSQRCNLMLDVLAPQVDSISVLQSGTSPTIQQGNVMISAAPRRIRHKIAQRFFRALTIPFVGRDARGWDQAALLWQHYERLIDPAFRRRVREMVRSADAVLLEYSLWAPIVAAACRDYRVPCVLTQHDVMANQLTRSKLLRWILLRREISALRLANFPVSVSVTDQDAFRGLGTKTRVIANPVDAERLTLRLPAAATSLLRDLYGLRLDGKPIALFVGSDIVPNRVAVKQLLAIAMSTPGVTFVLAGKCAEPGRKTNILATGPVNEAALVALYKTASIIVIPLELGTGSSLKTVEGLATGVPVLGTRVTFRGLSVESGENCLIEDDFSLWPETISRLIADKRQAERIGAAGKKFADAYDFRKVFAAYGDLLGLPMPRSVEAMDIRFREWTLALECLQEALDKEAFGVVGEILKDLPDHPPPAPARVLFGRDHADLIREAWHKAIAAGYHEVGRVAFDKLFPLGTEACGAATHGTEQEPPIKIEKEVVPASPSPAKAKTEPLSPAKHSLLRRVAKQALLLFPPIRVLYQQVLLANARTAWHEAELRKAEDLGKSRVALLEGQLRTAERFLDRISGLETFLREAKDANVRPELQASASPLAVCTRKLEEITQAQSNLKDSLTRSVQEAEQRDRDLTRKLEEITQAQSNLKDSLTRSVQEAEQRDRDLIDLALRSQPLTAPLASLLTKNPVAIDSADHVFPRGTRNDNTRHLRFVGACEKLFPKPIRHLDLGCAGGGLVWDFLLCGHVSYGIEGSNFSKLEQRAEWRSIPEYLFTADITKPFVFTDASGNPLTFQVISAWEVLEHIHEKDLPGLIENIDRHLSPGGVFVASVAMFEDRDPSTGAVWHVTIHPPDWWHERFLSRGWSAETGLFSHRDFVRGIGNPSADDWDAKTQPETGFHLVYRKRLTLEDSAESNPRGVVVSPPRKL